MTNFNLDNFYDELNEKLIYLFHASHKSVNELYGSFVATVSKVVNKLAPMRKASRKEKKLKLKPWITPNVLKSTKTIYKMFETLHKNKDDFATKEHYKTYRNALNRL